MPGSRVAEPVRREQIIKAAYAVAAAKGLDALTVRDIARRAGISHGLVLFHFKTKEQLVLALLDWLLATTTVLHITDEIARIPQPLDRLHALLDTEMLRLSSEPRRIRVFFDFWSKGIRDPGIRSRMRAELGRYRDAFRPMADDVLRSEPERFAHVSAAGLAAVAVSFINGCAIQSMIDPERFDIEEYLAATDALLGQLRQRHDATV
ncbi:MAG TPA: TetR family transcriptional regulator [Gemmatimonadaceae bacterium]|nr:TetR family transcriptional regulator [Gemmatimonadaceae bacterium]